MGNVVLPCDNWSLPQILKIPFVLGSGLMCASVRDLLTLVKGLLLTRACVPKPLKYHPCHTNVSFYFITRRLLIRCTRQIISFISIVGKKQVICWPPFHVNYCTVNTKRKALDFYEDRTVNCILDAIFYFTYRDCASKKYIYINLESCTIWMWETFVTCWLLCPLSTLCTGFYSFKTYMYIMFGGQHQNDQVCILTDVSVTLNVYVFMYSENKLFINNIKTFSYSERSKPLENSDYSFCATDVSNKLA